MIREFGKPFSLRVNKTDTFAIVKRKIYDKQGATEENFSMQIMY